MEEESKRNEVEEEEEEEVRRLLIVPDGSNDEEGANVQAGGGGGNSPTTRSTRSRRRRRNNTTTARQQQVNQHQITDNDGGGISTNNNSSTAARTTTGTTIRLHCSSSSTNSSWKRRLLLLGRNCSGNNNQQQQEDEGAASAATEKVATELSQALNVASEHLLDRLFSYLSKLPDPNNTDDDDDDDDEDHHENSSSSRRPRSSVRNYNTAPNTATTTGLTLPASAIGWLSSQIFPTIEEEDFFNDAARTSASVNITSPDDDLSVLASTTTASAPTPENSSIVNTSYISMATSSSSSAGGHHHQRHQLSAPIRHRISLLKFLLPRLTHLRITSDPWPPNININVDANANVSVANDETRIQQQHQQQQDVGGVGDSGGCADEDQQQLQPDAAGSRRRSPSSSPSRRTRRFRLPPPQQLLQQQRPYHEAFLIYLDNNIVTNPRIDMRLFPNCSVLLLDRIEPSWIYNLSRVCYDKLQVLRVDNSPIQQNLNLQQMLTRRTPNNNNNRRSGFSTSEQNESIQDPLQQPSSSPTKDNAKAAGGDDVDYDIAIAFSQLTYLKLSNCGLDLLVGGEAASYAYSSSSSMSKMFKLKSICLSHNNLISSSNDDDDDDILLSSLSNKPFLSKVDLSYNQLSCLKYAHTKLGNIQTLVLSHNKITTTTSGIDKLYALQKLCLDHNLISDLAEIRGLARLVELKSLKLQGNPFCIDLMNNSNVNNSSSSINNNNNMATTVSSTTGGGTSARRKRTTRRIYKSSSLYRVEVLDLFRERRLEALPVDISKATYKQFQRALPIIDGQLATIGEMMVLKERTFSQRTKVSIEPLLPTAEEGLEDSNGDNGFVLVDHVRQPPPRRNLRSGVEGNTMEHGRRCDPLAPQQPSSTTSMAAGGRRKPPKRKKKKRQARIRKTGDDRKHVVINKRKQHQLLDDTTTATDKAGDDDHVLQQQQPPVIASFTVVDVLKSISTTNDSNNKEQRQEEEEEPQPQSMQPVSVMNEGTFYNNDLLQGGGPLLTPKEEGEEVPVDKNNEDPDQGQLQTKEEKAADDEEMVTTADASDKRIVPTKPSAQQHHDDDHEDLGSLPNNDVPDISASLSPIRREADDTDDGENNRYGDDLSEAAAAASSTATKTESNPGGPLVEEAGTGESGETRLGASSVAVSSTPGTPAFPPSLDGSSSQQQRSNLRVVSPFPPGGGNLWQDDNNSVPSSIGCPAPASENASQDPDKKFHLAEEKSKFEGPNTYKLLNILNNLDLYFRLFVFNFISSTSEEASITACPSLAEENDNESVCDWMAVLEYQPKVQLWPIDRKLREAYHEKSHLEGKMPTKEEFRRVWKESVVACGQPALRRLTPNREPRYGFHGEYVWSSSSAVSTTVAATSSSSNSRPEAIVESRQVIVCLSNHALYFILDNDSVSEKYKDRKRKFPLPINDAAIFDDAVWPHALARHPLQTLRSITIGFSFQRLTLRFSNSTFPCPDDFVYILLSSNKMETISILKELQTLASDVRTSAATTAINVSPSHDDNYNAVKIDNDDRHVLDALGVAVAPDVIGAILHYQILHQRWKRGDRGTVRRVCVITDTKLFLLDEDYVGDGSESVEAGGSTRILGETSYRLVDSASLQQIDTVKAANADPVAITISIKPSSRFERTHNWRLRCRDGHGAEQLVEDVRKAKAIAW